ncbi:MAG: ATP-binding protein [Defluviitaleaceae bacterium]|nr:ATP-binding protein [Defluviitaleaceae bacterium]
MEAAVQYRGEYVRYDAKHIADTFYNYLSDVIYEPDNAYLDLDGIPEDFRDFGRGLRFFAECVMEAKVLANSLSKGDLTGRLPSSGNEIASPLKSLHASLRHLTWQTQQVAMGDYQQRVNFLGDFSAAFNSMATQLEERRKRDVREKSDLQQYINLILSNTPSNLLVFDCGQKVVLASESYMRIGNVRSAEELRGRTPAELFDSTEASLFIQTLDEMLRGAIEERAASKTEQSLDIGRRGELREYIVHATPIICENGGMMGAMVVFNDTTEITRAKREAERDREQAEHSTRAKSDFLARMTHEMRTPMNAIIGMTSIGEAAADIEKKDYSFEKIKGASKHLLGVINDILDMSKIEADKLELSPAEFNFEAMLSHVGSIINMRVTEKNQRFISLIDETIPKQIVSDEQHLAQVITNLLSNAVKFTPENGTVTLSAKKISESANACAIRFMVKDTGIGISEEQQRHLFTPFEQADGSISRKFGGTGLGLVISKRIVELMGGEIWIESELGRGAAFIFDITAGIGTGASVDAAPEGICDEDIGLFNGKRVMIAEDVEINREIISTLLEDTGVEIEFAFDGADAVKKFSARPEYYGAILMDLQMPEMDGYEATKRIRASKFPTAGSVPIIAMTANVFKEDVERCITVGMNGHLGKPVDVCEVIEKLKGCLL